MRIILLLTSVFILWAFTLAITKPVQAVPGECLTNLHYMYNRNEFCTVMEPESPCCEGWEVQDSTGEPEECPVCETCPTCEVCKVCPEYEPVVLEDPSKDLYGAPLPTLNGIPQEQLEVWHSEAASEGDTKGYQHYIACISHRAYQESLPITCPDFCEGAPEPENPDYSDVRVTRFLWKPISEGGGAAYYRKLVVGVSPEMSRVRAEGPDHSEDLQQVNPSNGYDDIWRATHAGCDFGQRDVIVRMWDQSGVELMPILINNGCIRQQS